MLITYVSNLCTYNCSLSKVKQSSFLSVAVSWNCSAHFDWRCSKQHWAQMYPHFTLKEWNSTNTSYTIFLIPTRAHIMWRPTNWLEFGAQSLGWFWRKRQAHQAHPKELRKQGKIPKKGGWYLKHWRWRVYKNEKTTVLLRGLNCCHSGISYITCIMGIPFQLSCCYLCDCVLTACDLPWGPCQCSAAPFRTQF